MLDAQNIEGDGATLVDRRCESHRLLVRLKSQSQPTGLKQSSKECLNCTNFLDAHGRC